MTARQCKMPLLLCMFPLVMLLLTGCHSHKRAVSSSGGGGGRPSVSLDYAREAADPMGCDLVAAAAEWLGTRYRYGGQSRQGTDCSGLVMSLYQDVCAVKLPRTTVEQHRFCSPLKRKEARVGDLMFFGSSSGISHVGLYIGKGEMIHASSSQGVVVSGIDSGYWAQRFKGAGRVEGAAAAWAVLHGGKQGKPGKKNKEVPAMETAAPLQTELASGTDRKKRSESAAKASPEPELTIDLLDLIINEKVDSIFSSQFMD